MNEIKQLMFSDAARNKMLVGVNILAEAVKATLGPKGRNVVIARNFGGPHVTKDGVSVAKEVYLQDPFENLGAQMVREAASRTADVAGDGTTTSTVLAQAILTEGMMAIEKNVSSIDLKRGIDLAVNAAVELIAQHAIPCNTPELMKHVAVISANGDVGIGEMIVDAVTQVGKDGVVTVTEGEFFEDRLTVVNGLQFDRGYTAPHFITDVERMVAEYSEVAVLVTDRRLATLEPYGQLLTEIAKSGTPLLIIAEEIEGDALNSLAVNARRGTLKVIAVRAPGFGERRREILKDIAISVGTEVESDDNGTTPEGLTLNDLGFVKHVNSTKDLTTLIDGGGDKAAIDARINQIKTLIEQAMSDYDREKLQERLAKLAGGVAVIQVGAVSEMEIREKKDRYDDALHALRAAIAEGVVPGGGSLLFTLSHQLRELKGENPDQNKGIEIALKAMRVPLQQIARNAGVSVEVITNDLTVAILEDGMGVSGGVIGYNAKTNKICNMMEAGVIDPAKVTRSALEAAASVGGLMLTTECMIVDAPKNPLEPNMANMGSMARF